MLYVNFMVCHRHNFNFYSFPSKLKDKNQKQNILDLANEKFKDNILLWSTRNPFESVISFSFVQFFNDISFQFNGTNY